MVEMQPRQGFILECQGEQLVGFLGVEETVEAKAFGLSVSSNGD